MLLLLRQATSVTSVCLVWSTQIHTSDASNGFGDDDDNDNEQFNDYLTENSNREHRFGLTGRRLRAHEQVVCFVRHNNNS